MSQHFDTDSPNITPPEQEQAPPQQEEALTITPPQTSTAMINIPLLGRYTKQQAVKLIALVVLAVPCLYFMLPSKDRQATQDYSQLRPVALPSVSTPVTLPTQVASDTPPVSFPKQEEEQAPIRDNHQLDRIDDELQALGQQVNTINDKLVLLGNQKALAPAASSRAKKSATHHANKPRSVAHKMITRNASAKPAVDIEQVQLLSIYPDLAWVSYQDSTYALHPGDRLAGLTVVAIDSHQRLVVTTAGNIH